ncbi:MAG: hypothetical protein Ct9H300mP7_7220 [Verrucomicrobiota bacterium]|nr:MAG: hypothetical protein Ct9H300mP7_7220 [Verrucomicrobiota bacterium]
MSTAIDWASMSCSMKNTLALIPSGRGVRDRPPGFCQVAGIGQASSLRAGGGYHSNGCSHEDVFNFAHKCLVVRLLRFGPSLAGNGVNLLIGMPRYNPYFCVSPGVWAQKTAAFASCGLS